MTSNRPPQPLSLIHSSPSPTLTSSKSAGFQPQIAPCSRMVNAAAARIYAAWRPHVGHAEALHQARAFAGRFALPLDGPLAPLADDFDLDQTLAAVALAMNALDATAEAL
jgi:hypothetical protein